MPGFIDISGRHHPAGTYYEGNRQPGDPDSAAPPTPGMRWQNGAWAVPTTPQSWMALLDWAALNVPEDELWALQQSMYGSFMDTAATAGNWGSPDGTTGGAAGYYVKLKNGLTANPTKYAPATSSTLNSIAAQFANYGVPITA